MRKFSPVSIWLAAGAAWTVATLAAPPVCAVGLRTYGALSGTTANKSYSNWSQYRTAGVKNLGATARDWLVPISLFGLACDGPTPCTIRATFRGGSGGASCVRAYKVNEFGQFTAEIGPSCRSSTTLAQKTIGTISTDQTGALLVVANLASGATPGAMTTVEVDDEAGPTGINDNVGAIGGRTAAFDTSNWGEYNVGGVRNKATSLRDWIISVPSPVTATGSGDAWATFGGGWGGQSCAIAYGVGTDGNVQSASAQVCRSSVGLTNFGVLIGAQVVYVASLARASTSGANDGGVISSVRF